MLRKLELTKSASDFLLNLNAKQAKQQLDAILNLLKNPRPHDSKSLTGYKNLFRVDTGEYRIIYRYNEEIVFITLIGKRNDHEVYDKLKRQKLVTLP